MSVQKPPYQTQANQRRGDDGATARSKSQRMSRSRRNRQNQRRKHVDRPATGLRSLNTSARLFFRGLAFILLGYGVIGRGFAYLGISPLYVGEIVLALGFLAMFNSGAVGKALKHSSSKILLLFVGWSAFMTVPYIPEYGIMALRDGVLWGYSLYALIVAAVVIANPQMMRWLLLKYRTFIYVFLASAWAIWTIASMDLLYGFALPGSHVDLFDIKGGDNLVHLAGVAAFVAVGMSKNRVLLLCGILFNFAFLLTSKRAGMVACALSFGLLILLNPPKLKMTGIAYAGMLGITILLLLNPKIDLGNGRMVSMEQVTDNIVSTFDQSGSSSLETTKSWRIDWWTKIISYSFSPEYILTGKGYGINLANSDGFQVRADETLRSPHNAHLNILARSGVPGFLLWFGIHSVWFISLLRTCLQAKKKSLHSWHGIFSFLLAYWVAIMVNASFDVYLEGPMGGIWLWSIMGFGIAAKYIYDHQPELGMDSTTIVTQYSGLTDE